MIGDALRRYRKQFNIKTWRKLPATHCAICNKRHMGRSAPYCNRIYKHHIFPKEIFGRDNDYNAIAEYYLPVCVNHHDRIHRKLKELKNSNNGILTHEHCWEAINYVSNNKLARDIKRRKTLINFHERVKHDS